MPAGYFGFNFTLLNNNGFLNHKNTIMKKNIAPFAIAFMAITLLNSCKKWEDLVSPGNSNPSHGHAAQTRAYSSEVAFKWMNMQLRQVLKYPAGLGGTPSHRYFAYGAIALYESVVPGMLGYRSLSGQLTDLPPMPDTRKGEAYY